MTSAIADVGMRNVGFYPSIGSVSVLGLTNLVKLVSMLAIPAINMYALSNIPVADAKQNPKITDDPDRDSRKKHYDCIKCMNDCDKLEDFLKIPCYAFCTYKVC